MESRNRSLERRMGYRMNKVIHTLHGTAQDIETIARLRPWMEDEIRKNVPNFSTTKLITDYDAKSTIFSFKIQFIS